MAMAGREDAGAERLGRGRQQRGLQQDRLHRQPAGDDLAVRTEPGRGDRGHPVCDRDCGRRGRRASMGSRARSTARRRSGIPALTPRCRSAASARTRCAATRRTTQWLAMEVSGLSSQASFTMQIGVPTVSAIAFFRIADQLRLPPRDGTHDRALSLGHRARSPRASAGARKDRTLDQMPSADRARAAARVSQGSAPRARCAGQADQARPRGPAAPCGRPTDAPRRTRQDDHRQRLAWHLQRRRARRPDHRGPDRARRRTGRLCADHDGDNGHQRELDGDAPGRAVAAGRSRVRRWRRRSELGLGHGHRDRPGQGRAAEDHPTSGALGRQHPNRRSLAGGYLPPGGALVRLRIGAGSAFTTYGVREHVGGDGRFTTTYTFGSATPRSLRQLVFFRQRVQLRIAS